MGEQDDFGRSIVEETSNLSSPAEASERPAYAVSNSGELHSGEGRSGVSTSTDEEVEEEW